MKMRDVLGARPVPPAYVPPAVDSFPVRPVPVPQEPVPFHTDGREYKIDVASWPCSHCGLSVCIEDVHWSASGERRLTFWSCEPCGVVAVTPDAIKEPPSGWVKRAEQ
jgi:hypothetical protein